MKNAGAIITMNLDIYSLVSQVWHIRIFPLTLFFEFWAKERFSQPSKCSGEIALRLP